MALDLNTYRLSCPPRACGRGRLPGDAEAALRRSWRRRRPKAPHCGRREPPELGLTAGERGRGRGRGGLGGLGLNSKAEEKEREDKKGGKGGEDTWKRIWNLERKDDLTVGKGGPQNRVRAGLQVVAWPEKVMN